MEIKQILILDYNETEHGILSDLVAFVKVCIEGQDYTIPCHHNASSEISLFKHIYEYFELTKKMSVHGLDVDALLESEPRILNLAAWEIFKFKTKKYDVDAEFDFTGKGDRLKLKGELIKCRFDLGF